MRIFTTIENETLIKVILNYDGIKVLFFCERFSKERSLLTWNPHYLGFCFIELIRSSKLKGTIYDLKATFCCSIDIELGPMINRGGIELEPEMKIFSLGQNAHFPIFSC